MSEKRQKIGIGHADAMFRQGIKEIGQVLPAFPAHSIQPVEEPGNVFNPTPQEIVRNKGAYETMLNGYAGRGPDQQNDRGIER